MSPEVLTLVVTVGGAVLGLVIALVAYIHKNGLAALEKKNDALEKRVESVVSKFEAHEKNDSAEHQKIAKLEVHREESQRHIDRRFDDVLGAISDLRDELRERTPSIVDERERVPPGRGSGR